MTYFSELIPIIKYMEIISGVEIMIVLKIIGIVAGIISTSFWLMFIIAVGVSTGLKNYFDRISK